MILNAFQFLNRFKDDESIVKYIKDIVFGGKIKCPKCGTYHRICIEKGRPRLLHCNHCNTSFSIFKGSIFDSTRIGLKYWFYAIHLFLNAKKGFSALQLQREIGLSYVTCFRIFHKIRNAMFNHELDAYSYFTDIVEMDEAYFGGKPCRYVKDAETGEVTILHNKRGRGSENKIAVFGIKERLTGRVFSCVMDKDEQGHNLTGTQLIKQIVKVCYKGTKILTDEFRGYNILDSLWVKKELGYEHDFVCHNKGEYSKGNGIHTNGIESFWAIMKRAYFGTYHHWSKKYAQKYNDEFSFRAEYKDKLNDTGTLDKLVLNSFWDSRCLY